MFLEKITITDTELKTDQIQAKEITETSFIATLLRKTYRASGIKVINNSGNIIDLIVMKSKEYTAWQANETLSNLFTLADSTTKEFNPLRGTYKYILVKSGAPAHGYQEVDISADKELTSATGLSATTQYYFKINIDTGGIAEYNITTATDLTYSAVIALMNTAIGGGATFSIVNGDLRCTSASTGGSSTIALSAGTTGTDLFVTLTDYVGFESAVNGNTFTGNVDIEIIKL